MTGARAEVDAGRPARRGGSSRGGPAPSERAGAEGIGTWHAGGPRRLARLDAWKRTPQSRRRPGRAADEGWARPAPDAAVARAGASDPASLDDARGHRSRPDAPPGQHRHDDDGTPRARPSAPARRARASRRSIGIIGAGAVGTALGRGARTGRLAGRRGRQRATRPGASGSVRWSPGARALRRGARPILDEAELIILAVPDDAIARLAARAPPVRRPGARPHERRCSAPRSSSRRWPPARRSARSIRSSPSPTPSGRSPPSTARRSRVEGDDQLAALLAEMAEAIGAHRRPARPGQQGRLSRRGGAGGRRLRRPARRDRRARRASPGLDEAGVARGLRRRSSSRRSATRARSGSGPR